MAQATRTVGPGTYVRDANKPTLVAQGDLSADTDGSWVQVDRPCDVLVEVVLGTIASGVSAFDIEIFGSDTGSGAGTNVVSYGRFGPIGPSDDNSTLVMAAHVYKPYMRYKADHTGSGACNVGIFVRTPHDRVTDSSTANPSI